MIPNINLDNYAEGNLDFRRKLAGLLIISIKDLQQALHESVIRNNPELFRRACHKEKTTLFILNNSDFIKLIGEIGERVGTHCNVSEEQISRFSRFCGLAIKDLQQFV